MKKLIVLFLALAITAGAMAQSDQKKSEDGAKITFKESSHNFGDITQGDKVSHTFEFTNKGNEPLILSNVLVSCGCTATNWPKDPIPPGESGSIQVNFNSAGKMGRQNKVVTVVSNAVNSRERIKIITNVLPKGNGDS